MYITLIFLLFLVHFYVQADFSYRSSAYQSVASHAIEGTKPLSVSEVASFQCCALKCTNHPQCESFNFIHLTNTQLLCEIFQEDVCNGQHLIKPSTNRHFYATVSHCIIKTIFIILTYYYRYLNVQLHDNNICYP